MEIIFKRTSTGAVQTWAQEIEGDKYRTHTGQMGGVIHQTGWVVCQPTNVGRANARTAEEQAVFEVQANYTKKLSIDYHKKLCDIDKPIIFKPMLAKKYEGWLDQEVYSQPKLDGIRCIATSGGMFSRNGKPILSCPHIEKALEPHFAVDPDRVFDGELYNHTHHDKFQDLVSLIRKDHPTDDTAAIVQYHIYDMPSVEDVFQVRSLTALQPLSGSLNTPLQFVRTTKVKTKEELDQLFAEYIAEGYEGQMVRLNQPYEQKRSKNLLKRKEFMDAEFVIEEILEGLGNWAGYAKKLVLRNKNGSTFGAGLRGNQAFCKQLLDTAPDHVGKIATVRFFGYSDDGVPRFPVVTDIGRDD